MAAARARSTDAYAPAPPARAQATPAYPPPPPLPPSPAQSVVRASASIDSSASVPFPSPPPPTAPTTRTPTLPPAGQQGQRDDGDDNAEPPRDGLLYEQDPPPHYAPPQHSDRPVNPQPPPTQEMQNRQEQLEQQAQYQAPRYEHAPYQHPQYQQPQYQQPQHGQPQAHIPVPQYGQPQLYPQPQMYPQPQLYAHPPPLYPQPPLYAHPPPYPQPQHYGDGQALHYLNNPHVTVNGPVGSDHPLAHQPSIISATQPSLRSMNSVASSIHNPAEPGCREYSPMPDPTLAIAAGVRGLTNSMPSEVKLQISAKNLVNRDTFSLSDPIAVVFEQTRAAKDPKENGGLMSGSGPVVDTSAQWVEIGRTECIRDNLNPEFTQLVVVPYRFEEIQNIRIGLWDIDNKTTALTSHDFQGQVETTLGDIIASGCWSADLEFQKSEDYKKVRSAKKHGLGTVTVTAHDTRSMEKLAITIELSAVKLARMDFLGKSDPYVIVTQLTPGAGTRALLATSEVKPRNLNPKWQPMRLLVDIPKGEKSGDMKLEFQVFDRDKFSLDDEIGIVEVTLDELEKTRSFTLVNSKHRAKGKKKSSGTLQVEAFKSLIVPSLVQYLLGGLRLYFSVAIDLTMSNGDPRSPNSLHYMDPILRSNSYTKALAAVGNVIKQYAAPNSTIASYGFGADIDNSGVASHCFPLNLHNPQCAGMAEVFAAYGKALSGVTLHGPTNLSPVIETAMELSNMHSHSQEAQSYDILLILTDGVVSDYNLTADKLIEASHNCALSVIIIGVGNADFSKMEKLDSDNELLVSATNPNLRAKRDIVQFVPFARFDESHPERLAAHVLAELPDNVTDYYTSLEPPILPNVRAGTHAPSAQ